MSSRALARQRVAMWRRDPRCHYCGVTTILRPLHIPNEPLPSDVRDRVATLDHVRARHHPDRQKPAEPGEVLHVLACWRCNNERDQRELKALPTEFLRRQCGAWPMENRSLDELRRLSVLLEQRKPRNKHKLAKWEESKQAVVDAIASKIKGAVQ